MKGLENKRVVITGGASGIGASTVERFLEEGSRVTVIDVDSKACEELKQKLPGIAGTAVADVADDKAVAAAFDSVDDLMGGLDILINNAGISIRHKFMDVDPKDWRKVIDINLNGIFYVAQQAAKRMLNAGSGVILNMGSTNALTGYHFYSDYNASKAGVVELTRSLALELGPRVRVNAVCPGFILTPMQEAEYTMEMQREFAAKLPLDKLGRPEDVAALFAFLASDEATFINGQTFVIDGGELAGGLASR